MSSLTTTDIANRIMRRDNYMIAMINKDILALGAPFPFNLFLGRRNIITKTIEWSLGYTVSY
jgi:autophagy-related protein 9